VLEEKVSNSIQKEFAGYIDIYKGSGNIGFLSRWSK